MGIFDFIKSQFIEVIEWTDMDQNELVYRFPVKGKEIKMGAQLTVRASQVAVFVNEGQIADVFQPGRYALTTENMPILTKLKAWKYGFNSPFKAEVYFVSTRQFTGQKWGTTRPVMMRDQDFGLLRLRAYGIFSYRVNDAETFLRELFGTSGSFKTSDIKEQLTRMAVSSLSDLLAESRIPALDFSMHYDELSMEGRQKLQSKFNSYGFKLVSFTIENISLPEDVEKAMDKRTSMGVVGDLNDFTKYQTAEAIREAANNEGGGLAGAGAGMGAGAAMAHSMMSSMNSQQSSGQPQAAKVKCANCGAAVDENANFCPSCGNRMKINKTACIECGTMIDEGTKFCPQCGASQIEKIKCSNCGAELRQGTKFCPECGTKQE
ncbi:Membrane protease subunit, stomatin/prohibitin family, contains C-terminal Zn-ribbon domain [Dethiosulfatibacter aminovorans DSM 17477]|uniref:Membrane protease subunit, stomatin/prohibitin family, contains C-terminal Zn-ribbon domain n=1 Tax=Dethiosulfatibacter aminovorans DSM 17477 TaxID=1121476 RepID=A0A1M6EC54_9FIRM|nr:SPFH domain-containing protein [Dethiosulfatibacter aminovorans]SHI83054.1 Membrane protease subunit, stomatin/prohibitin family, contains C-terminal Zn-ribbon domain [Dethiosulfatibacter aminovorans DSM 17477]